MISHTDAEHAAGAWLLLSKVAALSATMPYSKILDAFDTMIRWEGPTTNELRVLWMCFVDAASIQKAVVGVGYVIHL